MRLTTPTEIYDELLALMHTASDGIDRLPKVEKYLELRDLLVLVSDLCTDHLDELEAEGKS